MAFMQAKTCCCGCSLRTGTCILALFLLVPSALILFDSVSNSRSYSSSPNGILIAIVVSSVSAIYAAKMDQRLFLLPFMVIVIGIFLIMTFVCLAILMLTFGVNWFADSFQKNLFPMELTTSFNKDSASIQYGPRETKFSDIVGSFTILILLVCICIVAVFFHFVKVVCSLFAEMENPIAYRNGMSFTSPPSPPVIICSPPMSLN